MRINEIFLSVQGETTSAGLPTIFVRTGGCNIRCTYCDTPYALTTHGSVGMNVEEVINVVRSKRVKRVCLTGGEPLIQPQAEIQELLNTLALENYEVSIETSGSIALRPFTLHDRQRWILDMKTPSSGESQSMLYESLALLRPVDEVKFVVGDKPDFDWSVDLIREHNLEGRTHLLFSPTFGAVSPLELTTWVLESGIDARVQIQIHKIIWDPATRGV